MLRRGPKKGLTVLEIAERAAIAESTVSRTIQGLNEVSVIGYVYTGQRGRPAKRYALAA